MGQSGEEQAAHFLISHGFQILDRNVRFGNAEVDLVALDVELNELIFVEVKTRSSGYYGDPSGAVGWKKMQSLEKVARQYRKEHDLWLDYRFDVIAILPKTIEHFTNVTW